MLVCPAKVFDIPSIMAIEHNAFIPEIQEKQKVFEQRLAVFPEGFFVLQDASDEIVLKNKKALTVGYFSSELWSSVGGDDFFALGHSPKKLHDKKGTVLYISSVALLHSYRGKGLGEDFFKKSVEAVCGAFSQIRTLVLLVNSEWKSARHIYEKLGFTPLRTLPGFFPSLSGAGGDTCKGGGPNADFGSRSDGILMTCPASLFREQTSDTKAVHSDDR